ncbi:hypothetical protein [Frankia sp. CcWB3]
MMLSITYLLLHYVPIAPRYARRASGPERHRHVVDRAEPNRADGIPRPARLRIRAAEPP